jgi:hypothetical protein
MPPDTWMDSFHFLEHKADPCALIMGVHLLRARPANMCLQNPSLACFFSEYRMLLYLHDRQIGFSIAGHTSLCPEPLS